MQELTVQKFDLNLSVKDREALIEDSKKTKEVLKQFEGEFLEIVDKEQALNKMMSILDTYRIGEEEQVTKENLSIVKENWRVLYSTRLSIEAVYKHNNKIINEVKKENKSFFDSLIEPLKLEEKRQKEGITFVEEAEKREKEEKERKREERLSKIDEQIKAYETQLQNIGFSLKNEDDLTKYKSILGEFENAYTIGVFDERTEEANNKIDNFKNFLPMFEGRVKEAKEKEEAENKRKKEEAEAEAKRKEQEEKQAEKLRVAEAEAKALKFKQEMRKKWREQVQSFRALGGSIQQHGIKTDIEPTEADFLHLSKCLKSLKQSKIDAEELKIRKIVEEDIALGDVCIKAVLKQVQKFEKHVENKDFTSSFYNSRAKNLCVELVEKIEEFKNSLNV